MHGGWTSWHAISPGAGPEEGALGTQPRFLLGSQGFEGAQLVWEVLEGGAIVPAGPGQEGAGKAHLAVEGYGQRLGAQAGLAAVTAGGPLCCGRWL